MAAEDFIAELDGWVEWYRSGRAKMSFGWRTMDENRRALGYSVWGVQENVRTL